jgi:hypothetical protein
MNRTSIQLRALAVAIVAASLGSACASTKLLVRPGSTAPDPSADKFLVMPVDIHGLKGDKLAQEAALFGGFVAAFRENGVPLQPIKPALEAVGVGNLSWELAEGMFHLASFHNKFDFKEDGGFHGGDSKLPLIIEGTAKLVELAAKELKLDFKPKYVTVAHIDGVGGGLPKTVKYRVIAGIYNVEAGMIDQVIWYEQTTADEEAAILAEMGTLGSKLYGLFFAEKKVEEKK